MTSTMVFGIPLWAELVAVGVGALQGALFAGAFTDRRIDVLGAVVVGIGVALGGAILRDVLLDVPLVVLRGEWYVLVAIAGALLGMSLRPLFAPLSAVALVLEALTIGTFGAIGASKALSLGVPPAPAMLVGAIAAVGGSVFRDVMLGLPIALLHVGSLYATAAAAGTMLLVGLAEAGVSGRVAAIAGVVLTTAVRLLAVRFRWNVPEQHALALRRRERASP